MTRRTAAIVLALVLNPILVYAQDTVLTVSVASADIHKGPSIATPVIGHVSRGTVLRVSNNLGSWVKVPWPEAQDGAGYVHVTMGRLSPANADTPAMNMTPRALSTSTSAAPAVAAQSRMPVNEQITPRGRQTLSPITHIFGVGGLIAAPSGFGATARAWNSKHKHLAIQVGLTRNAMTSDVAPGRVTSTQVEPGVIYAFFDQVSDYFWIRPYAGSVVSFRHQTLRVAEFGAEPVSDNSVGFRIFGGSEITFAGVPRLGVSADIGYRRFAAPFAGFKPDPLSVSIAGHWYIK
jgi:hypothetical protein